MGERFRKLLARKLRILVEDPYRNRDKFPEIVIGYSSAKT